MKYKLTDETREHLGVTAHRIQALESFGDVKAGDLGGWVESTKNLAQQGTCWLYDDAVALSAALVTGSATAHDQIVIGDSAMVFGAVHLRGGMMIFGNARLFGEFDYVDGVFMG